MKTKTLMKTKDIYEDNNKRERELQKKRKLLGGKDQKLSFWHDIGLVLERCWRPCNKYLEELRK